MDRPQHNLLSVAAKSKQSRAVSGGVTIAIHVGIIAALIIGLSSSQLRKEILDINAFVVAKKALPKALPPPPPELVRPPPTEVAAPEIVIERAPPPPVVVQKEAAPPPPPPTKLTAIERTHTLPPYPDISQRLGEQGTTTLKVTIGIDGNVTDVAVEKSSGSQRLDQAASDYVKSHWRWQPPTQGGKPIVAVTLVSVVWDLKNAQ